MIHPSTILIADISGFTNFVSSTELEHSSHIVNELLELIIESEELELTVSEIEGDAVLFYKTGDPVSCSVLVNQCVTTFERFHRHLKKIERDAVCRCGVCQAASNLGLKFISHFGTLKEINVANFRKASGLDMIIAHRLLKNEIPSNEYVLVTDAYLSAIDEALGRDLDWSQSLLQYADVGEIGVHWADLGTIKKALPDPPERPSPVIPIGADTLSAEIAAPMLQVYAGLIDVEKKREWVIGLDGLELESPLARVGQRHVCYFQGSGINFELLRGEVTPSGAVYSESAQFVGMPFRHQQTYTLAAEDDRTTSLTFEVSWGDDPPPDDLKQMFLGGCSASIESFKEWIEA